MSDEIDPAIILELLALSERAQEDRLYEMAINEIELNELDKVAMAFAFEEAEGNRKKSRAFYPKHRVRRIRDALIQAAINLEEQEVKALQQKRIFTEKQKDSKFRDDLKSTFLLIVIAISSFVIAVLVI